MFFCAAMTLAALPAAAQSGPDGSESQGSGGWRVYPSERHILVRAEATLGARLNDPYSAGALAPVAPFVEGSFLFLRAGRFLMGPSLGAQVGIDRVGVQATVQPGWTVYRRFSGRFAASARVDVPLLITQGGCGSERVDAGVYPGAGYVLNRTRIPVPNGGYCPALSVGIEAAVGGSFYLTSGFALTAEAIFDTYFGDSGISFPILGGGVGVLFDYEVLP